MKSKGISIPFYHNRNAPKPLRKGKLLLVDEIFYSIQTEGPFTGQPSTFLRLWGCSLNCSFCDTKQDKKPTKMEVGNVVLEIQKQACSKFVVITGGEPFLHYLNPLVSLLTDEGFFVQFETSGTVPAKDIVFKSGVYAVVSPKTLKIDSYIAEMAIAFKYVVGHSNIDHKDGLPKGVYRPHSSHRGKIMVSPMFTDNKKETRENITLAVNISKTFGYYFTLQYHKLINIR